MEQGSRERLIPLLRRPLGDHPRVEFADVERGEVAETLPSQPAPRPRDRAQDRGQWRRPFQAPPRRAVGRHRLDRLAPMRGAPVPDHHEPAGAVLRRRLEEGTDVPIAEGSTFRRVMVQPQVVPAGRPRRRDRNPRAVGAAPGEGRRPAPRRPGAPRRGRGPILGPFSSIRASRAPRRRAPFRCAASRTPTTRRSPAGRAWGTRRGFRGVSPRWRGRTPRHLGSTGASSPGSISRARRGAAHDSASDPGSVGLSGRPRRMVVPGRDVNSGGRPGEERESEPDAPRRRGRATSW